MLVLKETSATFFSGLNLYWCPCCKKASQWADPVTSSTSISWGPSATFTVPYDED
jgi:hypothetical protein